VTSRVRVKINYSKNMQNELKELIEIAQFDYVNFLINTRNFPTPETVKNTGFKLIEPKAPLTSEEALQLIESEGCRPANLYELIEWRRIHGNKLDKETWVLAFGQLFDTKGKSGKRVPFISFDKLGIFTLSMGFYNSNLGGTEYLLGIEK
jgi:hypothetical protein